MMALANKNGIELAIRQQKRTVKHALAQRETQLRMGIIQFLNIGGKIQGFEQRGSSPAKNKEQRLQCV